MIYCLRIEGLQFVKFGLTNGESISSRLSTLQVGCPLELIVAATADWLDSDELRIHSYLRTHNVRGEWFELCNKTYQVIDFMLDTDFGRENFIQAFLSYPDKHRLSSVLQYASADKRKKLSEAS